MVDVDDGKGRRRVGVLGGRGVVGARVLALLERHPHVVVAASESSASCTPEAFAALARSQALDGVVLCTKNGVAAAYEALLPKPLAVVDVSGDHRTAPGWVYGLCELHRRSVAGARRIANPGCYATAVQLALAPFLDDMVPGSAVAFGVSGYSGAGSTPSPKNDVARLTDNLMPYDLVDHSHEAEIERHLGTRVALLPHVAAFFSGISLSATFALRRPIDVDGMFAAALDRYTNEQLVRVLPVGTTPEVKDVRDRHWATIGGFAVSRDRSRAAVVCVLDNLWRGAATQAVQNLNLALGLPELASLDDPPPAAASTEQKAIR